MAIKRGVSLYSYQQAQFFKQMDWKDMIAEVRNNLKTDGVEIIDEATIKGYPFPSEQFIFDWRNHMARYDMTAVTMCTTGASITGSSKIKQMPTI